MIAGWGTGNAAMGRGFNEVLSLSQRRAGIVESWRTETPGAGLPDTSMTGTISAFLFFPVYPCALKQRFNRLPHFAKPVFFCLRFLLPGAAAPGIPLSLFAWPATHRPPAGARCAP